MDKPLIIFGIGEVAQLAHFYFNTDSEYTVTAFTVDSEHLTQETFCGLPVIDFKEVAKLYPPEDFSFFVALGYNKLNETRKEKYTAAKSLGYQIATYLSTHATILNEGEIGENCFILEDNTIQPFVTIGNNVTLWSGNHIGHHSRINDHCFIASHVVVSGGVEIGEQCFIGVNATFRNHIKIGSKCVIGAGALILNSSDSQKVYFASESDLSKIPSNRLRGI